MAPRKHPTPASALEKLQKPHKLKILAIAETLSPKDLPQSAQKRTSAVSEDSEQNGETHPAALEADLAHYKVRHTSLSQPSSPVLTNVGIVQQTPIQLRRASHEREIPTKHNGQPAALGRSRRKRREREGGPGAEIRPQGAQTGDCRDTEAAARERERIGAAI